MEWRGWHFSPRPRSPSARRRRYIFCATFLQVALTGRYPAHCPAGSDFPRRPRPSRLAALGWVTDATVVWPAATFIIFGISRDRLNGPALALKGPEPRKRELTKRLPGFVSCFRVFVAGSLTRRFPGRSGTARASCTNCCAACRSPRRSWRYSSRFRAIFPPDTPARSRP